ncbi:MAG: hypothetical protein ACHP65_07950 [Legionellales bacterium]
MQAPSQPPLLKDETRLTISQPVSDVASDIGDIILKDIWTIVCSYVDDDETNNDSAFPTKTPHLTLLKLFILSPRIATQILQQRELTDNSPLVCPWKIRQQPIKPEHTLADLTRCYAIKMYMDTILLGVVKQPTDSAYNDIQSQLIKTHNNKCQALTTGVCLGLIGLSAYSFATLGSGELDEQYVKVIFAPILLIFGLGLSCSLLIPSCIEPLSPAPCNPFKKTSVKDFHTQQVLSHCFNKLVPELKVREIFANFLNIPLVKINTYKMQDVVAAIESKYNSALKNWRQADSNSTEDPSSAVNRKIQSVKDGKSAFFKSTKVNAVIIDIDNYEEEKHFASLS